MKHLLTTLIYFYLVATCMAAETRNDTVQRIASYLSELEKIGFNGSVIVAINNEAVLSQGYGYSNLEQKIKNAPSTVYDIGSLTKQFTAAAILKLEMQDKLSTNDKLSRYFVNVPDDKAGITLHDLLRHQSGLKSNVGKDYEKISREEFINKVFTSSLNFETGKGFHYSNIGYSLLAMIIEKVSGLSYETYLYENLWKPLQMETTGYTRPDFDSSKIAVCYYIGDSIWGKPTDMEWDKTAPYWHLTGNGGILSTTEDLLKWHIALTTENPLSKEAKQKLYRPKLRPDESETNYYAYGWDVSKTNRNTTRVWHNGTNHIFYADFMRYIDEGIALIMLSNQYHQNFNGLNMEIAKMLFNPAYKPVIPVADNETNRSFTMHIINTIEADGSEKAKNIYQNRNNNAELVEFMMREEGFSRIDNGQPEIALQIFELNVLAHPKSPKALQGLGEAYMETGKKDLALKYFQESLNIDADNPFLISMIDKLK